MAIEDDEPRPTQRLLTPPPLDRLGVAELREYIAALRDEIARVEAMIARKGGDRSAAEAVFARR